MSAPCLLAQKRHAFKNPPVHLLGRGIFLCLTGSLLHDAERKGLSFHLDPPRRTLYGRRLQTCGQSRLSALRPDTGDIVFWREQHDALEYLGKIEGIPVARQRGDILDVGESLSDQHAGVLDPQGAQVLREADMQHLFEGLRQIFSVVLVFGADGFKRQIG